MTTLQGCISIDRDPDTVFSILLLPDMLPDDMLEKILLLLPMESIVCLASTCKKWLDYLLDDDDFARRHLDRWRSRYGFLYSSFIHYSDLVYSPIFDGSANELILERLEDCFSKILKEAGGEYLRVLDSCDGLLLIACGRTRQLVVCNPLMRSYKFLQLPPTTPELNCHYWNCHWDMVYDASIKRYKIIAITSRQKVVTKGEVIISKGRRVYILELCRSSSESSEWKECVWGDELGGVDFGGKVRKSALVEENGEKKKLYYLTCNNRFQRDRFQRDEMRTSLIYIDIETHQVKAVEAATCSSMSLLRNNLWVGSSSSGRFYMSNSVHIHEEFNLFVLEDLHNPIWKMLRVNGRNTVDLESMIIQPLAVVQDNGNDEEEKILYLKNGMIYEYQTVRGLRREVSNNTRHHFRHLRHNGNYHHNFYVVPHLHSLIRI